MLGTISQLNHKKITCTDTAQSRCLTEAAVVAGCLSQYDTECTCTSPAFRDAVQVCLKDACTADDAESMIELYQTKCLRITS